MAAYDRLIAGAADVRTEDAEAGRQLLRDLIAHRGRQPTLAAEQVYFQARNYTEGNRAEDADPGQTAGGHFAYCLDRIDDPECRALFSRVIRRMRVALEEDLYDLRRIRRFWAREVRPQQMAFYRVDLLDRFASLPGNGWTVGPV